MMATRTVCYENQVPVMDIDFICYLVMVPTVSNII